MTVDMLAAADRVQAASEGRSQALDVRSVMHDHNCLLSLHLLYQAVEGLPACHLIVMDRELHEQYGNLLTLIP